MKVFKMGNKYAKCFWNNCVSNNSNKYKEEDMIVSNKIHVNGHVESNEENDDSNNNEGENEKIPTRYFWSGGCGIVFALVNSCFIFCAFPQHHIFKVPSAWYEFMTTAAIGFIGLFAASLILNCEVWLNIRHIKTWKNFLLVYLMSAFSWILANIGYYHIYTVTLELKPPMPLNIHVCGIFTFTFVLLLFWVIIPRHVRSSDIYFWKRYLFYVLAQVFRYIAVIEYFILSWLFVIIPKSYQLIIAVILPIIREINGRVLTAICYKSAGTKSRAIKITCVHEMGCRHAVFLSVAISLLASRETAALALGLDVGVNLLICLKIIWRSRVKKLSVATKDDIPLQVLALKEKVVPWVVPLSYCICFMVAYFGPNKDIIGNVGNTSWHFDEVESLDSPLIIMSFLFLVHLVSIVIWTLLLRMVCGIRYLDGYMHIQKEYWLIMAIHEAYSLNEVC